MIFLILLLIADTQSSVEGMWELRAGRNTETIPIAVGASLYIRANNPSVMELSKDDLCAGIDGGDKSLLVPLAAILVSEGRTDLAEIYWEMRGLQLPATRNDLLDALAWFGRYELFPVMALKPAIPPDMEGTMHADQCGAVCALGWMTTRKDGLFHGDEQVGPLDIQILSTYFPSVNPVSKYIPVDLLESLFRTARLAP